MAVMDEPSICLLWQARYYYFSPQVTGPPSLSKPFKMNFFPETATQRRWVDTNSVENLVPFLNQIWDTGLQ